MSIRLSFSFFPLPIYSSPDRFGEDVKDFPAVPSFLYLRGIYSGSFLLREESDKKYLLHPTCRTSVTMCKRFFVYRQMIVNDMLHLWNIKSTGSEVGRDQYMTASVTELIQCPFPIRLFHTAMKTFG